MGSATGEAVSGDFVNYVQRSDSAELRRILGSGISDQKKAYLQEELARREAGESSLSVKEATKKYAESRSVAETQLARQQAEQTQTPAPSEGGYSRVNPLTGKAEYVLPSGIIVDVNPATTQAIVQGKKDFEILAISKGSQPLYAQQSLPASQLPGTSQSVQQEELLLTVEPAQSTKQQYKNIVSDRGYVFGSLYFLGQKASGIYNQYEIKRMREDPSYRMYQTGATSKLISTSVQTAPFFVPYLGSALVVWAGFESVGTKGGRERIDITSEAIKENYNIPKFASKPVIYGANVAMIYFGSKSGISQAEKALGLPKTKTVPMGFQQATNYEAGQQRVVTDVYFKSQTKNLLGTKTEYGFSRSVTFVKNIGKGKYQLGDTLTFGTYGQRAYNPMTGDFKFVNLKQFNVIQKGISREASIMDVAKGNFLDVYRIAPDGFKQLALGKGAVGKNIFGNKLRKFYFVGRGKGFGSDPTKIFGKVNLVQDGQILKQGSGKFKGLVFKVEPDIPSGVKMIRGSGKKSSQDFFNELYKPDIKFTGEIIKNLQSSSGAVSAGSKSIKKINIKSVVPDTKTLGLDMKTEPKIDFSQQLIMMDQRVDLDVGVFNIASVEQATKTKYKFKEKFKIVQVNVGVQVPKLKDVQVPGLIQKIIPVQKTTPKLKMVTPSVPNMPTPFVPKIPSFPIIPLILPPIGLDAGRWGKRQIRVKRVRRYTPSYSAIVFKIFGKKPTGIETGLRVRPITKGFSFSNLFKNPLAPRRIVKKKRVRRR